MKYEMSKAAAHRVMARLVMNSELPPLRYARVLDALREEGFASPRRAVADLVGQLHADDHAWLAAVADCCAREARDANEKLDEIRRGLSAIGVRFEEDA